SGRDAQFVSPPSRSPRGASCAPPHRRPCRSQGVLPIAPQGRAPQPHFDRRSTRGPRSGASLIDLVVDASVAFKWLIPDSAEDDVPAAKALLVEHMEGRTKIISRLF